MGAGLTIQPNGLRALDALGLGERLRAGGPADPPAGIRSSRGDWLVRNDVDSLKRRFGPWVTVHRAALVELRERFARWHHPIPALLGSTQKEAVLQHDTYELPALPTYVSGNVAVLGDAAHAMTPNLGQGACQALEDSVTLAHAVDTLGVRAGLAAYDRARRPRTQLIVRRSRQAGAAAHWTSTPLTTLRDAVLPLMPNGLFARSLTPAYTWTI